VCDRSGTTLPEPLRSRFCLGGVRSEPAQPSRRRVRHTNTGNCDGHYYGLTKLFGWRLGSLLVSLSLSLASLSLLHFQPFQKPFTCGDDSMSLRIALEEARVSLISPFTHATYVLVSGRAILFFGSFAVSPFDSSDFVISRQSRYIMYGSSNLTLKKNDEPGEYGDASACALPLVGGEPTVVRTTKPSSASSFHFPLRPISSVNALTLEIEGSSWETVTMNPHSRANSSTTAVD
jgi:hypothetical protein